MRIVLQEFWVVLGASRSVDDDQRIGQVDRVGAQSDAIGDSMQLQQSA